MIFGKSLFPPMVRPGPYSKSLSNYGMKESYFETCPRRDGHCIPKDEAGDQPKEKPAGEEKEPEETKPEKKPKKVTAKGKQKAVKGVMVEARREGTGKDAKIVLSNGQKAPKHIPIGKIPATYSNIRISMDPKADIWITATGVRQRDGKPTNVVVYNPKFQKGNTAIKWARTREGLKKRERIAQQIQKERKKKDLVERADCAWLMQEQATRPGSEADNKGMANLFGEKMTKDNFVIGEKDKNGVPKVTLKVKDKEILLRDKKARLEIAKRVEEGKPLEDSEYWLKSFGASTLEGRHIVETEDGVRLQFMGKETVWHNHLVKNPELAKMLLDRKQKAGDKGKLFNTDYGKVSRYVSRLDGGKFTPKDLRTVKGTNLAIEHIREMGDCCQDDKEYKQKVMEIAEKVSSVLGNEPKQALESYIDPTVFSVWRKGGEDE